MSFASAIGVGVSYGDSGLLHCVLNILEISGWVYECCSQCLSHWSIGEPLYLECRCLLLRRSALASHMGIVDFCIVFSTFSRYLDGFMSAVRSVSLIGQSVSLYIWSVDVFCFGDRRWRLIWG